MHLNHSGNNSLIPSSEHLIFNQVKNGSSVAYSKLYDLYAAPLFGIILKWVNNKDVAIDIFQKSFIAVYKKCKTEEFPKFGFLVWMCGIALDITKNKLKNKPAAYSEKSFFTAKLN